MLSGPGLTPAILASIPTSVSLLTIPSYTLTVGGTYTAELTVTTNTAQSVQSAVSFTIEPSPLVAIITGSDRQRSVDQVLYLDATSSYDPGEH